LAIPHLVTDVSGTIINMKSFRVPPTIPPLVEAVAEETAPLFRGNLWEAFVFCVMMVVLALWSSDLPNWQEVIVAENGPVERMSAGMWFMAMVWCLAAAWKNASHRIEWLGFTTLFLLFGLRELDAQVWATGWNLEKFVNYWNPRIPLWERLLVIGFMILPTMAVAAVLCARIWARLGAAWTRRAPWIGQMTAGGIFLVVCMVLDKMAGLEFPLVDFETSQLIIMGMEEFGELVLAVYVVSVLWPYWQEIFSPNASGS
jgi:hypothetical protein